MTETARTLGAKEVRDVIHSHIAARLEGGPNRKEEDIELGRTVGLKVEMISDLWDEAETQVQANIELQVLRSTEAEPLTVLPAKEAEAQNERVDAIRPAASKPKRRSLPPDPSEEIAKSKTDLSFLPAIQPKVEKTEATPLEPAVAEPSKALVPVARFGNETPRIPDTVPATLAQSSPYDTAKEYVRRHCFREGVLATYFWQNEFWEWNGRHYETVEPQIIRDRVYAFLDGSRKFGGDELTRFKPTPKIVNDVLDALKAG
jgi:hypothetical protein